MIIIGGMIGLGKSSVATLLGKELGSEVFYESVDNNPILPLFYTATTEEIEAKRYPFLLQLYFLNTRFKTIKDSLINGRNIIDRGIYEDVYFCYMNMLYGQRIGENRISELEYKIYLELFNNMMEELAELPKKSPDLMVYLKGSFDTVLNRIKMRGRDYELDDNLLEYYRFLWEGYDAWVTDHYRASDVLIVDMDKLDIVNNEEDANQLVNLVRVKLDELGI